MPAAVLDTFPDTAQGCLDERFKLIKEVREDADNAAKDEKPMNREAVVKNGKKLERARKLKDEHDRLIKEENSGSYKGLLSDLGSMEDELEEPVNKRITTGQGGRLQHESDVENFEASLNPGFKRFSWNVGDRTRNGRPVNRSIDIGGRRASHEYRLLNRQRIVGNERVILGPNGQPINTLTTIQSGDDTRAGYFVLPEQMTGEILKTVDDDVFVQQWARVTYLRNAKTVGIRRRTAKANAFNWGSELSDATDNLENALKYGKRVLEPHYITGAFRLSRDLIAMADINIEQEVISELMIDLREFLEQGYFTGDGVQKCLGLLTASADGISTSRDWTFGTTATTFNFNTIIKAKYNLKSRYLRNAFIVMHPDRIAELAMLRTDSGAGAGTGPYLWQPSRIQGDPDVACGVQIRPSYFMPSATGSGNYFALFGDFSYYRIVIGMEMEMQILREIRARTNENEYLFRMKLDAAPVMEEAFLRFKYA